MEMSARARARIAELRQDGSISAAALNISGNSEGFSKQQKLDPTAQDIRNAQAIWNPRNALSPTTGGSGGFTVPLQTASEIIEIKLGDASCMRRECVVIPGGEINEAFPYLNDGQTEGRQVGAGQGAIETDPAFVGRNSFGSKFSSDKVTAPNELVRDARGLIPALLSALARRVGRRQNRAFTYGTGANEPMGLAVGCDVGVTTANAGVIAMDELLDLEASVDAEYTHDGSAAYMLHPTLLAYLKKQKDGQGRYLWRETGLGDKRVILNMHMPSTIVNGMPTVLYGNFARSYCIRELETRFITLTETYAESDQTAYELLQIADGFITDPAAVKSLVVHS